MKTALLITSLDGWRGDARLYKLSEPHEGFEYVIVSAIQQAFDTLRPETYIFGATPEGSAVNYLELEGSFRGSMDHELALANVGYTITEAVA